jgi:hypothetical protein
MIALGSLSAGLQRHERLEVIDNCEIAAPCPDVHLYVKALLVVVAISLPFKFRERSAQFPLKLAPSTGPLLHLSPLILP